VAGLKSPANGSHEEEKSSPSKEPAAQTHEAAAEHEKTAKEAGGGREGAVKIQERAREMEKEAELRTHQADHYDSSELFLEISIVLCSIALVAENKLYWKLSFITSAIGVAIAIYGLILH
jgi:hypothetical protein